MYAENACSDMMGPAFARRCATAKSSSAFSHNSSCIQHVVSNSSCVSHEVSSGRPEVQAFGAHLQVCCSTVAAADEELWVMQVEQALPLKDFVVGSDCCHIAGALVQARRFGVQLRQWPILERWVGDPSLCDGFRKRQADLRKR